MACVSASRLFCELSRPRAVITTLMSSSEASLTTSSKNRRTSGRRSASSSYPKDPSSHLFEQRPFSIPSHEARNVSRPLLAAACGEPLPRGYPPASACLRLVR
jgi:hypothetical protein